MLTRRQLLAGTAATTPGWSAPRPKGFIIDTHIHLFAADRKRFPYHRNATYRPPAADLEDYVCFAAEARIDRVVIVHPEPYQDDHSYLEFCFQREPSRGFFKGTCLYDPIAPDTPARMAALVRKHSGRIVALRIHSTREARTLPTTGGAIRDRDLSHPAMKQTWRAACELGLALQMHFSPWCAPQIGVLAAEFRDCVVVLDHLGRASYGTAPEYEEVLKLARLPRVFMKFSAVRYSSRQDYPHADARPLARRVYEAFGPGRIIWGGLGHSMSEFEAASALLDQMFDFAPESERARIRGLNAKQLYAFS